MQRRIVIVREDQFLQDADGVLTLEKTSIRHQWSEAVGDGRHDIGTPNAVHALLDRGQDGAGYRGALTPTLPGPFMVEHACVKAQALG